MRFAWVVLGLGTAAIAGLLVFIAWSDGRCARAAAAMGAVRHEMPPYVGCLAIMADGTVRKP